MSQITHEPDPETGAMRQIVPPATLREILNDDGDDYGRPTHFRPDDEWDTDSDR